MIATWSVNLQFCLHKATHECFARNGSREPLLGFGCAVVPSNAEFPGSRFVRINSYLNLKPSRANFIELEAVEIVGAFAGLLKQKDEGKCL